MNLTGKTLYDISVSYGDESIDYPGDTRYSSQQIASMEKGQGFNLSQLIMSAHSGTHIDAPSHFVAGGTDIDRFSPDRFILPAQVVDIPSKTAVESSDLADVEMMSNGAVLFKTGNSTTGICRQGKFVEDFIYLTPDAADVCVEKGISILGFDYITIEKFGGASFDAHHKLLSNGIFVLEGLDLSNVSEGRYTLICLPLKLKGVEASPVRAVLIQ